MNTQALDLFPEIRRARGYRLYDERGNRYLDLYQDKGRAILGHRHSGLVKTLKNQMEKGGLAPYPSRFAGKLDSALHALLPEFGSFRWYDDFGKALIAITSYIGYPVEEEAISDPAIFSAIAAPRTSHEISFWRPFVGTGEAGARVALPVLPFPGSGGVTVVAFDERVTDDFHPSDIVSPVVLAGMSRSLYDLKRFMGEANATRYKAFDEGPWRRNGPYLVLTCEAADFRAIFGEFVEKGIVLSPFYPGPSIIPGEFDDGEVDFPERGA